MLYILHLANIVRGNEYMIRFIKERKSAGVNSVTNLTFEVITEVKMKI